MCRDLVLISYPQLMHNLLWTTYLFTSLWITDIVLDIRTVLYV